MTPRCPFRAVLVAGLLVLLAGCGSAAASTTGAVAGAQAVACSPGGTIPGWTAEQLGNARTIAQVALGLGLGQQGALVGIDVAITESTLVNVGFGDIQNGRMTTSRGLFQQIAAWAPEADRMDPVKSATMFFTGGRGGQRGLTALAGWETMPPAQAAQSIQGSEFSSGSNYSGNLAAATTITEAVTATCSSSSSPTGMEQNPSQDPSSFGWVRAGPLEPMVWQGHNFGQVARGTAALFSAFLDELVPLIPGGLNGYLGAYENRQNVNSPGMASFHSFGLALDINYNINCNGCSAQSLQGKQFALPMATDAIAKKYGLTWGGSFRGTPDPMHTEAHITPQQVAAFTQGSTS